MSLFICPVCRERLESAGNSLKCNNSHTFDKSAAGDVFLLRSSKGTHGDSREMVLARRDFLELGFYKPLADTLAEIAERYVEKSDVVYFDAGCGTGYYTECVHRKLSVTRRVSTFGVDISKDAVKMCAKRMRESSFAVASVYDLPVADKTADLITNVFSPQAEKEYSRILKDDGVLLYVVPAPHHLYSMKEVLYENPYENEDKEVEYEGFKIIEKISVDTARCVDKSQLESLFRMTPYFWRTSREGSQKLMRKESLKIEFCFYIYVFKKDL